MQSCSSFEANNPTNSKPLFLPSFLGCRHACAIFLPFKVAMGCFDCTAIIRNAVHGILLPWQALCGPMLPQVLPFICCFVVTLFFVLPQVSVCMYPQIFVLFCFVCVSLTCASFARKSSTPTEDWDSYLREAAWPGMAAGVVALFISFVLLADVFIGRMDLRCGCGGYHKATRRVCGLALLILCMVTCLAFIFATAMAAQNIFSIKPHLNGYDPNNNNNNNMEFEDEEEEEGGVVVAVNCTPKTKVWHLALGSAIFGFLSCVFTCWLIESRFLRSIKKIL